MSSGRTRFIFIRLVGVRGDTSRRVEGEIMLEYGKGKEGVSREGERGHGSGLEQERKHGYVLVLNYNRRGGGAGSSQ